MKHGEEERRTGVGEKLEQEEGRCRGEAEARGGRCKGEARAMGEDWCSLTVYLPGSLLHSICVCCLWVWVWVWVLGEDWQGWEGMSDVCSSLVPLKPTLL